MAFAVYDHTPLVGCIQWQDLNIAYQGTSYAITNGYTSDPYVWWDPAVSTTTLQTGTSLPALSDDALLVFLNKSGVHVTVPKATVVDGSLIVEESILTNALAANSVTTDKIVAGAIISEKIGAGEVLALNLAAGAVEADKIAVNAVTAGKIAAGAVETDKLAANAVNADKIAANAVEADAIAANAVTTDKLTANAVTAAKLASIELEVGKHVRSTSYSAGSAGWSIEADGSAEFNDVTVRGTVEASEFHGAPTANILGVNGTFDTNTTGWTAYTANFPSSAIARVTSPVRSGAGALRVDSSSGAGVRAAYTEVTVAPGDIVHAAGWVRKDDVSDNAAESWWDTVTVNVDFYDNTNALVHQYFHDSIQANAVEWRLLEVYAAAPLDLGITKARVYFSSYSNAAAIGKYALYLDDVTIGIAPLLEVPYMVTHEDGERKRALITPQQFAFESQFSNYPYGLMARHNAHTPSLRITGPYGFGNQAPQLELEHDLLGSLRLARFGVNQLLVTNNANALRPDYSFTGDTDTGILRGTSSGQDALFLVAGGDYPLMVRSDGAMLYPRHPRNAGAANVYMSTTGWVYRSTSSRNIKRDIETLDESVIDRLRPVSYKLKPENVAEGDDPDKEFVGFIAEEVAEADPRLAQRDEDGEVVYFDTNALMAHMVKELQSLRKRVEELEAERGTAA